MTNPVLTMTPEERAKRSEDKRRLILRFLRSEIYSTPAVLSKLIQTTDPRTIRRTLARLEEAGEVVRDQILTGWRTVHLVGITTHGQAAAWRPDAGEELPDRYYQRGKAGLTQLEHKLDLQRIRIDLGRAGWKRWQSADAIEPSQKVALNKSYKRPDALIVAPSGKRVAIECERSVKNPGRYKQIVGSHLTSIKQGKFDAVIWAAPTEQIRTSLVRILERLAVTPVDGIMHTLQPADRARLIVTDFSSLPTLHP